jgi:hypothetical protein
MSRVASLECHLSAKAENASFKSEVASDTATKILGIPHPVVA